MSENTPIKNGRARLKDIAQETGFSVSTVSLVLRGKALERRISAQVEQQIQEVARKHDYSPNLLVQSLQNGLTGNLCFYNAFGFRDAGDLYIDGLTSSVERAAGLHHYDVLVHSNFARSDEETYHKIRGGYVDGLIFFGPDQNSQLLDLLRKSSFPTVLWLQRDHKNMLSSVCDDMESGMKQVAQVLSELGHKRVYAWAGDRDRTDSTRRINTLRHHLAKWGIELPSEAELLAISNGPQTRVEIIRELMAKKKPPTAIFCWHDRLGYEILEACSQAGVSVPEQLSLVGYDGVYWPSQSHHKLASVVVNMDEIATTAVKVLDDLIHKRQHAPLVNTIPVGFSTGTTLSVAPVP